LFLLLLWGRERLPRGFKRLCPRQKELISRIPAPRPIKVGHAASLDLPFGVSSHIYLLSVPNTHLRSVDVTFHSG